jgi:hypothetical protein
MSPTQFLKQLGNIPRFGKDGFRRVKSINIISDLRTTAGLVLTAATVPTVAAIETNAVAIVAAAGGTANGTFTFVVPDDYADQSDELKIRLLVVSGGTDVPTQTATAYRKRAGAALTAALTVVASAAIPTAPPRRRSGSSTCRQQPAAGDVLTINLVSGAHATDTVIIHGIQVQYKSGLVFADPTTR